MKLNPFKRSRPITSEEFAHIEAAEYYRQFEPGAFHLPIRLNTSLWLEPKRELGDILNELVETLEGFVANLQRINGSLDSDKPSFEEKYPEFPKLVPARLYDQRKHLNDLLQRGDFTHGTTYGYRLGCRCDECRAAHSAYGKAYREKAKAS